MNIGIQRQAKKLLTVWNMSKYQFSGIPKSIGTWVFTPKATRKEGSVMEFITGFMFCLGVEYLVWIVREINKYEVEK